MICPIALCIQCSKKIYKYYPYEGSDEHGEPPFCSKKCEDEYLETHDTPPRGWYPVRYN